ncbi:YdeI/OmpD-associated family protein [Mycetocola sp. 2940]|uniref:YdeI/OmpD-associated family protein n=1 Tax=Mycetocola sp. 2940 TaxID=3156452 RepID=UPI003394E49F
MPTFSDPGPVAFDAVLTRSDASGSSAFVAFPFDVEKLFGTRGRVPVNATFDGIPYRGSLVTYGDGHMILVLGEIRSRLGKEAGDTVAVTIELDTQPRVVDLEDDIVAAWTDAGVLDTFRGQSYSHQREYALWIAEAKRAETRATRIAKAAAMIAEGRKLK